MNDDHDQRRTEDMSLDELDIALQVRRIRKENRALFARLVDGEKRFRRLAKAVWMVQEEERRALARELHDGIGQTLTALKNQLERLRQRDPDNALADGLADSVELASLALNDTRELSRLLRPAVLDDLGLDPALRWLSRTLGKRASIRIEVDCDLGERRLEPDVETLVFRVVQEALTNIIKHAQAPTAWVAVHAHPPGLRVRVRDEGAGFDPEKALRGAAASESLGLRGMRDRLELFGGRIDIQSSPGAGSTITMSVPLSEIASAPGGER